MLGNILDRFRMKAKAPKTKVAKKRTTKRTTKRAAVAKAPTKQPKKAVKKADKKADTKTISRGVSAPAAEKETPKATESVTPGNLVSRSSPRVTMWLGHKEYNAIKTAVKPRSKMVRVLKSEFTKLMMDHYALSLALEEDSKLSIKVLDELWEETDTKGTTYSNVPRQHLNVLLSEYEAWQRTPNEFIRKKWNGKWTSEQAIEQRWFQFKS